MGLDISLRRRPIKSESIGEFRNNFALQQWLCTKFPEYNNCVDIEASQEVLIELLALLNSLTNDNCRELFPCCRAKYSYDYWDEVDELKIAVTQAINYTDFDENMVYFRGWW